MQNNLNNLTDEDKAALLAFETKRIEIMAAIGERQYLISRLGAEIQVKLKELADLDAAVKQTQSESKADEACPGEQTAPTQG